MIETMQDAFRAIAVSLLTMLGFVLARSVDLPSQNEGSLVQKFEARKQSVAAPSVKEIYSLASTEKIDSAHFNPVSQSYALILSDGQAKEFSVIVNGKRIGRYYHGNYIFVPKLSFSSNGKRYGYVARDFSSGKQFAVIDGNKEKGYDEVSFFVFSPDGSRYGYVAREKDKHFVIISGKEETRYDSARFLQFSSDSRHYGYEARKGSAEFVVIDGKEGKGYEDVKFFQFYRVGARYAFIGSKAEKDSVVIDGKEVTEPGGIIVFRLSPDGKHYSHAALEGSKLVITLNGKKVAEHDADDLPLDIKLSPDGKRYGYAFLRSGTTGEQRSVVVINGKMEGQYAGVSDLQFSADNNDYGYVGYESCKSRSWGVCNGGDGRVVINGQQKKRYSNVEIVSLTLSPSGSRYAYVVRERSEDNKFNQFVVIDGSEQKRYLQVESLQFSPNGRHYAYIGGEYKSTGKPSLPQVLKKQLVLDNAEVSEHDGIYSLAFLPDSKSLTYLAAGGSAIYQVTQLLK